MIFGVAQERIKFPRVIIRVPTVVLVSRGHVEFSDNYDVPTSGEGYSERSSGGLWLDRESQRSQHMSVYDIPIAASTVVSDPCKVGFSDLAGVSPGARWALLGVGGSHPGNLGQ